ncbi:LrgB family protein [Brevibacillus fulvus]|uniref:Effector of murein hydrolase n=1 Tax=Brevibacillus fulvus TaxID=1125967 RepID=A0A938Y292_9BACL|nr:LrgB family protein [Brevibacillus fulvus]MBM7589870.1 putative effector of murein hydrolase [Brevibacillus fulvus]
MLEAAAFFVTVAGYLAVMALRKRISWLSPLVGTVFLVGPVWWLISGDWQAYQRGGDWIAVWLGPATVALAVPLAKQAKAFIRYWRGALLGIAVGCALSPLSAWLVLTLANVDDSLVRSLLSKSVTTPISLELTKLVGGISALAAVLTALTGMIGSLIAGPLLKRLGITDDWAIGVAVGTAAHAIGTASLQRSSPIQAAAASVAMIISAICTSLYLIPLAFWL